MTDKEIKLLIKATGFSLNSIFFKNKLGKDKYLLPPIDILGVVNLIQQNLPAFN